MKKPIPQENGLAELVYRYRKSDTNSIQTEAIIEARQTEPEIRGVKMWNKVINEQMRYAE